MRLTCEPPKERRRLPPALEKKPASVALAG
jgi:hypothetical protein